MSQGKRVTAQDQVRIKQLYTEGHSIAQTCEATGFSPGTVRKVLIELGVPRRSADARNRVGATERPPGVQPVLIKRNGPGDRSDPPGNCVRCRRRIPFGGEYVRIPGVLGKVCTDCAGGHEQGAAGDQRTRASA